MPLHVYWLYVKCSCWPNIRMLLEHPEIILLTTLLFAYILIFFIGYLIGLRISHTSMPNRDHGEMVGLLKKALNIMKNDLKT